MCQGNGCKIPDCPYLRREKFCDHPDTTKESCPLDWKEVQSIQEKEQRKQLAHYALNFRFLGPVLDA